jgi:hypothetical protein
MFDTFYGHIKVSGGEFGEETSFQYRITLPTGQVISDSWDFEMGHGDTSWCSSYYENPAYGTTGTIYFEVLDMDGNSLAKEQARITY